MSEIDAPTVLYVEDEAMVALVVQMALEEAGFAVEHVLSGSDAIKALDVGSDRFSGLITDVRLPEIDGWNIARHARELMPTFPVLYVSGDSAAEWATEGVAGSIMVQKPFANERLVTALKALLDQGSRLPHG